jgi:hypothetical protein
VNLVVRQALLCGFSVERTQHDYGIDLVLNTYNSKGEIETGLILVQVKATDRLKRLATDSAIRVRLERTHLNAWLKELMPVVVIVYDAQAGVSYWLYVQAYFEAEQVLRRAGAGRSVTVHIPRSNLLDPAAIRRLAGYKNAIIAQTAGRIHHAE